MRAKGECDVILSALQRARMEFPDVVVTVCVGLALPE